MKKIIEENLKLTIDEREKELEKLTNKLTVDESANEIVNNIIRMNTIIKVLEYVLSEYKRLES